MKSIILMIALAVVLSACGKSSADTSAANSSNSKSANSSSSSSSSSPEATKKDDAPKDLTPLTMSAAEIVGSYDESKEGRMVTVTGGRLDSIQYGSLTIRNGSGYAFACNGSFGDYMKMAPQIDSLRQQGKSPIATVKGVYKKGTSNGAELGSCILTDLAK